MSWPFSQVLSLELPHGFQWFLVWPQALCLTLPRGSFYSREPPLPDFPTHLRSPHLLPLFSKQMSLKIISWQCPGTPQSAQLSPSCLGSPTLKPNPTAGQRARKMLAGKGFPVAALPLIITPPANPLQDPFYPSLLIPQAHVFRCTLDKCVQSL